MARAWRPWRSKVVWGLIGGTAATAIFVKRTLRDRDPATLAWIKQFNRRWANPAILRLAGGHTLNLARLEHRGRQSGALYATPVWAEPVSGGFLLLLPYGSDVDWARNLLDSGSGVLQHGDIRYRVGNPRIVPSFAALPELPLLTGRVLSAIGIRECMRLDVLPSLTAEVPPPA